jgi:hypothetical protein
VPSYIPPRNGSLINDNGTIYLISDGQRIGFASAEAFSEFSYSFTNAQPGDTSFLVTQPPVTSSAIAHPDGTVINENGTLYVMQNGYREGVPSMKIFNS